MIKKIAFTECTPLPLDYSGGELKLGFIKTAASGKIILEPGSDKHRKIEAEIKKHPNSLFFRSKSIEANIPNQNGDCFSEEELIKSYKSFEGVPFFTNHDNQHVENAKGKVIFAEWVPEEKAVYTIQFVDRDAYPNICRSIEEEYVSGVSMGALHKDAQITMADGLRKSISQIEVGEKVLSPYGNIRSVKKVHSEILWKPMYELLMRSYHDSPLFSHDHPVYVIDKNEIEIQKLQSIKKANANKYLFRKNKTLEKIGQDAWRSHSYNPIFKELKDIVCGDYALIPSKYTLIEESKDSEKFESSYFYYVGGAYLGDGWLDFNKSKKVCGVSYSLGLHEKSELGEKLKKYITKILPCNVHNKTLIKSNSIVMGSYNTELANKLLEKFGVNSHSKRIFQKEFTKEQISSLVAGYIDTDGAIAKTYNARKDGKIRGNGIRGVNVYSCNKSLLEDLQSLLILIDVPTTLNWNFRKVNKNSLVRVPTTDYILSIPYGSLHLFKESIKIAKHINFNEKPKIKAGEVFIFERNKQKYMVTPILEIKEHLYKDYCYDLSIEKDECYIANGLAVHNCTVESSSCSICENAAEKPEEFCSHIKNRKGRKFTGEAKSLKTGKTNKFNNAPIFEWNHGIKFIELSAVVDPACPTCHIQGIIPNTDYLKKVANIQNDLYMVKTAALEKHAAKEDIDNLENVLKTLEEMAIKLIQNRKQVEPEFASDLVSILTELQEWTDELVAAGFGNFNPNQTVPGVQPNAPASGQTPPPASPDPGVLNPMGISETNPAQSPVNDLTSTEPQPSPQSNKPTLNTPKMPTTPSIRPKASNSNIVKTSSGIIDSINNLIQKYNDSDNNSGETMARRTLANKEDEKNRAIEVLSSSWKEKKDFLQYIENVPSIQKDNYKLSISKKDDAFVIVAQTITSPSSKMVWDYSNLNQSQKDMIINNPQEAANAFLDSFANSVNYIKEGEDQMSQFKSAGANSVNSDLEQVTQGQLDKKDLYHARTNKEADETTQGQLGKVRTDKEADVTTQKQLDKFRTNKEADEVTQGQLDKVRTDKESDETTQGQLDSYRSNKDIDEVTETQLNKIDSAWKRVANRDSSKFMTATAHMQAAVDAIADVSLISGATPNELCEVIADVTASSQKRHAFANKIVVETVSSKEVAQMATRLSYWSGKNVKISSLDNVQVEQMLATRLSKVASLDSVNPDVLMSALDVIGEGGQAAEIISKRVEAKLQDSQKNTVKASSVKDELRSALTGKKEEKTEVKIAREARRKILEASVSSEDTTPAFKEVKASTEMRGADHLLVTSFQEIGFDKNNRKTQVAEFKKTLKSFAKGGLAANGIRLAAITNVTIDGDSISIAVQTDNGDQKVEIPIGDNSAPSPDMPEGDMSGENLGNSLPPPPVQASSKKKLVKAQAPMGGAQQTSPGAANQIPGETPTNDPVQALTTGEDPVPSPDETDAPPADEPSDEIPNTSEQQMPWSICPECGTSDVDVQNDNNGNITGQCKNNDCGCKYEALIKKEVEFKLIKPTKSVGKSSNPAPEAPEAPEVPALPVAASIKLNGPSMKRIASNEKKHGHVCPACGTKNCKIASKTDGVISYNCKNCGTSTNKTIMANLKNPSQSYLQVSWDVFEADSDSCNDCKKEALKFASKIRANKLLKSAAKNADNFPMTNCMERVAQKWGTQTTGSYGPCKGKVLAECVCSELQKLGFTTVRHMERIASVSLQKDPQDQCVEEKMKEGFEVKEASSICNCLKKKAIKEASKQDPILAESFENPYLSAFLDDINSGKEKVVTAQDLINIKKIFDEKSATLAQKEASILKEQEEKEMNTDLSALPVKEASKPKIVEEPIKEHAEVPCGKATIGNEGPANIDVKTECFKSETKQNTKDLPDVFTGDAFMGNEKETQKGLPPNINEMTGNVAATTATSDKTQKKADTLTTVDSIINDVNVKKPEDAGTAISDLSEKSPELTNLDIPLGDASMGNEKETQSGLPDNNHEMLKNVASESCTPVSAKRSLQLEKIAKARENEAIKTASWLASTGRIGKEKEDFSSVVKALSAFPLGEIGKVAERMFPSKEVKETKVASKSTEETGIPSFTVPVQEVKAPENKSVTLANKLSGLFTIGNQSTRQRLDFLENNK